MLAACHHRHGQKGLMLSFFVHGHEIRRYSKSLNAECFMALIKLHH